MAAQPKIAKCRSCGAEMYWATMPSGKKNPVDAVPDQRPPPKGGKLVLTLKADGELTAEFFDPSKHDAKRNRYTSHFGTCPNAAEHRRRD